MALCKNCARSGLFLKVDTNGLCGSCAPFVIMEIQQKGRLVDDCMQLVSKSKNLDVRLTRYDFLMENLRALLVYEHKAIPTISPLPSSLIAEFGGRRDKLIIEHVMALFETAKTRLPVTTSVKSKINHLNKVLLSLRDHKDKLQNPSSTDSLEREIVAAIHGIQLNGYLDAAKKAEFKGQKKKALDQYYEALYFLKHDDIDDSLQADHIATIEAKVAALEE